MRISKWSMGTLLGLALCGPAMAAEFGVMESAESIEPNAFKLSGFPLVRDRANSTDEEGAFAASLGYGLPYGLDIEGQVARYDEGTTYGSDIEWNAWTTGPLAFSFGGGGHTIDFDDGGTVIGADTTAILTWTPVHRLDVNTALVASYEDVNATASTSRTLDRRYQVDNEFETYYFVPGVEYSLTRDIDLLAEVGLGLNGTSDDYASAGVSWYLMRR